MSPSWTLFSLAVAQRPLSKPAASMSMSMAFLWPWSLADPFNYKRASLAGIEVYMSVVLALHVSSGRASTKKLQKTGGNLLNPITHFSLVAPTTPHSSLSAPKQVIRNTERWRFHLRDLQLLSFRDILPKADTPTATIKSEVLRFETVCVAIRNSCVCDSQSSLNLAQLAVIIESSLRFEISDSSC